MEDSKNVEMLWFSKDEANRIKQDYGNLIGKSFFIDETKNIKKVLTRIVEIDPFESLDAEGSSYVGYNILFEFYKQEPFSQLHIFDFMKYNLDVIPKYDFEKYCKNVKDL